MYADLKRTCQKSCFRCMPKFAVSFSLVLRTPSFFEPSNPYPFRFHSFLCATFSLSLKLWFFCLYCHFSPTLLMRHFFCKTFYHRVYLVRHVLHGSTHYFRGPVFDLSSCFIPLWCLGQSLSLVLKTGKGGAKDCWDPPFKDELSRSGFDMEHKIQELEDTVTGIVMEIICWN